uniref:Uncharacterized protein n=1 Tax=Oryza glumipatula TaxID=40148 RepID=A0A0E0AF04_9ORYZ
MTEGRKGGGISWVSGQEGDRRDGRAAGRLLTPTVPHDFRFEEAHRSYCSLTHGPEGLSDPHVMPC